MIAADLDDADARFAAEELRAFLLNRTQPPYTNFPSGLVWDVVHSRFLTPYLSNQRMQTWIALGTMNDTTLAAIAKARGAEPPQGHGHEAYTINSNITLNTSMAVNATNYLQAAIGGGALVMGASNTGMFWGMKTMKQIINATAGTNGVFRLPAVSIHDWPDMPVRGVLMEQLGSGAPDPSFWPRIDFMADHKMNFAVGLFFVE